MNNCCFVTGMKNGELQWIEHGKKPQSIEVPLRIDEVLSIELAVSAPTSVGVLGPRLEKVLKADIPKGKTTLFAYPCDTGPHTIAIVSQDVLAYGSLKLQYTRS